jgi:hypothetical protein
MKRVVFLLIAFLLFITVSPAKIEAKSFQEAQGEMSGKPLIILIYAQWADNYQSAVNELKLVENKYLSQYNFVALDIAKEDAKFYNAKYNIAPNLPYIVIYKQGGKISRFLTGDCTFDSKCIENKMNLFLQ